jgi:hypothetical protein
MKLIFALICRLSIPLPSRYVGLLKHAVVTPIVVLLWVGILLLAGCAVVATEEPTNFHLISDLQLRSVMQGMANRIVVLTELSMTEDNPGAADRNEILLELNRIQQIARGLRGESEVTNYSVINRYMGSFLYDIEVAKQFAKHDPPNFVPANRLVKSCLSCHQSI